MYIEILIIGVWVACGIVSYGYNFAYYQREYPSLAEKEYKRDMMVCIFLSVFGPINLLVMMDSDEYRHGIKFK